MKAHEIYEKETGEKTQWIRSIAIDPHYEYEPHYIHWLERRAEVLEEVRRILNSAYDPYSAHDIADILGKISRLVGVE
jgi:hypothetical protein